MKDFFFAYTVIGPKRIRRIQNTLTNFPKNSNILIVTNTPEMFDGVSTDCNLYVVNIEDLRTDKNREQEPLICSTNDEEYDAIYNSRIHTRERFPGPVIRHAMFWLLKNNATKFALIDPGCAPLRATEVINDLSNTTSHQNIILLNPLGNIQSGTNLKYMIESANCLDIVESCGVDLSEPKTASFRWRLDNQTDDVKLEKTVGSEGYMYGYWFNNKERLDLYYHLWNSISERIVETGKSHGCLEGTGWSIEQAADMVNNVFAFHFDTLLAGHNDIIKHVYTSLWPKT